MISGSRRATWTAALLVAVFLAGHLPFLASSLEDIDSVNFALGVADFDVAAHRPHPPGYPIFTVLGKAGAWMFGGAVAPGLAVWGALLGALAVLPLVQLFRTVAGREDVALAATAITIASPLVWFNASRPMSDIPGLAAALVAQALLATAFARQRAAAAEASRAHRDVDAASLVATGRLIVLGALAAGVALGMRSQTAWLTLPLLGLVLVDRAGRGAAGAILGASMTFAIGVLVWAVPLMIASGGPLGYWRALTAQAGEDIARVDMLATNPTAPRFAEALLHTFVQPWASIPLAAVVLLLALFGLGVMLMRSRRGVALLAAAVVPYLVFHLVFQETFTTRYALPIVPVVGYLAATGLAAAGRRVLAIGTVALVGAGLALAVPALSAYAHDGSPVAQMVRDVRARTATADRGRPALVMHHPFVIALRGESLGLQRLPAIRLRPLVDYWAHGGGDIWFLAEPGPNGLDRHHDLALFDPSARRTIGEYRWPFDPWRFVGGVRPSEANWYVLRRPGWMALEGWALTPALAGRELQAGPAAPAGITALVARRGDATVLVGGRNLGGRGASAVRFTIRIDGQPMETWSVPAEPPFFLRLFDVPAAALAGTGEYARLTVTAEAANGGETPVRAAIEQFDVQPPDALVWGYDEGWHEQEYSPARGRLWRWTSGAAKLRIAPTSREVTVRVTGESPLRYFDEPPVIALRAGARTLGQLTPTADFSWMVRVPPDALTGAGGTLTLTTSRTFVPNDREGNGDLRELGLRIYSMTILDSGAFMR